MAGALCAAGKAVCAVAVVAGPHSSSPSVVRHAPHPHAYSACVGSARSRAACLPAARPVRAQPCSTRRSADHWPPGDQATSPPPMSRLRGSHEACWLLSQGHSPLIMGGPSAHRPTVPTVHDRSATVVAAFLVPSTHCPRLLSVPLPPVPDQGPGCSRSTLITPFPPTTTHLSPSRPATLSHQSSAFCTPLLSSSLPLTPITGPLLNLNSQSPRRHKHRDQHCAAESPGSELTGALATRPPLSNTLASLPQESRSVLHTAQPTSLPRLPLIGASGTESTES